jgi:hypothetical protein
MRRYAPFLLFLAPLLVLSGCDDPEPEPDAGIFVDIDSGPPPMPDAGRDSGFVRRDAGPPPSCDEGSTVALPCVNDRQCDDNCFCNGREVCAGSFCQAAPVRECDDGIECTVDVCDEDADSCESTIDDGLCSDGDPCTGEEICDLELGCLPGVDLNCSDGDTCTSDRCDPDAPPLYCVNEPSDLDGDGFVRTSCEGGTDCNDDPDGEENVDGDRVPGSEISPDADEICGDGIDNDCDGFRDFLDVEDCSAENLTCATAQILPGGVGMSERQFTGLGATDDYQLDCEAGTGNRDVVFQFTLTSTRDVVVQVDAPNAAVEVRNAADCGDDAAEALGCEPDTSGVDTARLRLRSLEPGDYNIIVSLTDDGPYDLELTISVPVPPPPSDLCDGGAPLIDRTLVQRGDFTIHNDDYPSLTCGAGAPVDEAAYRLSLPAERNIELDVVGIDGAGMTGRDVAFAILTNCDDPVGTTVACGTTNGDPIDLERQPQGEYYIVVEPNEAGVEEWELSIDIETPPARTPGDRCTEAVALTGTAPTFSASTSAVGLLFDQRFSCDTGTGGVFDAYFELVLDSRSDVDIVTSAAGFHTVEVFDGCAAGFATGPVAMSCKQGFSTTQTVPGLAAGTYYIGVGDTAGMGTISVTATVTAAP